MTDMTGATVEVLKGFYRGETGVVIEDTGARTPGSYPLEVRLNVPLPPAAPPGTYLWYRCNPEDVRLINPAGG